MEIHPSFPLVDELIPPPDPEAAFLRLVGLEHCLFLDSALRDPALGRYSFLAAEPFAYLEQPVDAKDSLGELAVWMADKPAEAVPGLPPFQGGAAGLLSYDLGRQLEAVPHPAVDEFNVPAMALGFYDVVVAFDHLEGRAWIISQGLPELEPSHRQHRAEARLRQMHAWLAGPPTRPRRPCHISDISGADLAPQHPAGQAVGLPELSSNFAQPDYLRAIEHVIAYICDGDVFQVNLAQRLLHPARDDAASLYMRLRRRNPATFAGYFDLGTFQIVSASPERFLQVRDRWAEARPIKGTRPRSMDPKADHDIAQQLAASEKDRAENVMIVDLLRNDLSRVCQPDSVEVGQLCRLESYEFVHHLVSSVRGRLRDGCGPIDLVRAAFPGGSITGAPKPRAMEIIAELEPTARGPYCGALGYLGFDGSMDLSILIRTITAGRGWWQIPVGGGIVAQSVPQQEYEETWHKAEGMIRSLT